MPAAHAGAHADSVVAAIAPRLHQDRPGIHLAQVVQRLVQGGEALLIAALRVAHHVTLAHGVVAELAPQSQLDDIQVEPETPLTVHARLELERERQAVPQRAADGRTHRVLDARMPASRFGARTICSASASRWVTTSSSAAGNIEQVEYSRRPPGASMVTAARRIASCPAASAGMSPGRRSSLMSG